MPDTESQAKPNPVLEGLFERRTVLLAGQINNDSAARVAHELTHLQMQSEAPVNLLIDSPGGELGPALKLCGWMTSVLTVPIRGIAFGECSSSATFVMLHCSERIGTPYSAFTIHSGTRSRISIPIGESTSTVIGQLLNDTRKTEAMVMQLYMAKLTPAEWTEDTSEEEKRTFVSKLIQRGDQHYDDRMSASEALAAGLIQRVHTDSLGILTP